MRNRRTQRLNNSLAVFLAALFAVGGILHPSAFADVSVETVPGNAVVKINGDLLKVLLVEPDEQERVVSTFNDGLRRIGVIGRIASCARLIDIPVGVKGGNDSYGGYCKLEAANGRSPTKIKVCADEAVGYFVLAALPTPMSSDEALIIYVATNCFGG